MTAPTAPNLDAVIERIQKLQRMAESGSGASENEVAIANAAIKRLLAEHNLSASEVAQKSGKKLSMETGQTHEVNSFCKWNQYLHHAVNEICGVRHFYRWSGDGVRCVFVGYAADVAVAVQLYETLRMSVHGLKSRFLKEAKAKGLPFSKGSYMLGVAIRIYERAKEAAKMSTPQAQQKYELMVVDKKQQIQQYLDAQNLSKARSVQSKVHGPSYQRGYADGRGVSLSARTMLK